MKHSIIFLVVLICISGKLDAQLPKTGKLNTTTILPEGTSVKNGKINVLPGYRAFFAEYDKKVVIIQKTTRKAIGTSGGTNVTGTFSCRCEDGSSGDCNVQIVLNNVSCEGFSCKCEMTVLIKPGAGLAITTQTKGETWKKFIYPSKTQ